MASTTLLEGIIRDKAGEVISMIRTRRDHPTYGVTRVTINAALQQMEGMIGMYMVVTEQAMHANVPLLAKFTEPETSERVTAARRAVSQMQTGRNVKGI